MDVAERFGKLSTARRLNVGAIIVKDNRIISIGYNGMPSGWDNNCEIELDEGKLKSKPEVLHAESNAIAKLARSNESGENSTLFLTHSPCLECSKLIYQSGITTVYYKHEYRSQDGVEFLNKSKINVHCVNANG
jgi:dCMP deaminase